MNTNLTSDFYRTATTSQLSAIALCRTHVEGTIARMVEKYGAKVTQFNLTASAADCLWLHVETELTALPEDNLLRATSHDYWFFEIGKRGKITAHQYPKSYEQFKGRRAFGFTVK